MSNSPNVYLQIFEINEITSDFEISYRTLESVRPLPYINTYIAMCLDIKCILASMNTV